VNRATYLDSSAIVKLAVAEPESGALRRYLRRRKPYVTSALARAEVARALLPFGPTAVQRGEAVLTRIDLVRSKGMKEIAKATPARWFSAAFQSSSPQLVASALRAMESQTPDGYIGGCCAVRDFDARNAVSRIHAPTLVLSGTHDPATPPADGQFLAEQISGARYVEVNASHLSSVEAPDRVTTEVLSFLV